MFNINKILVLTFFFYIISNLLVQSTLVAVHLSIAYNINVHPIKWDDLFFHFQILVVCILTADVTKVCCWKYYT